MRCIALVLFICVVTCRSEYYGNFDELARIDSITQEPECSTYGGMCVIAKDCSGQLTRQTGLCPRQASKGVECCHGLSLKETRCSKLGVCVPTDRFCAENLIFKQAADCESNEKCCIVVH